MSAPDTAAKARQIHIMLFGNEFVCAAITGPTKKDMQNLGMIPKWCGLSKKVLTFFDGGFMLKTC